MTTISAVSFDALQAVLRGELIVPGHPEYESARRVYNGSIDKRPAAIARCVDAADVISVVNFAREHELPLAVRGGGHSAAGKSTCDDGLVIDLARMNDVRIDPVRRVARVGGGATWGDFDHAGHAFGLSTPGGVISSTGVGGLTLGGGFGYLTRKHGLSCDNLLSADVVTADGNFLTASETEHADLFWALRGGGGNFGVATSFEFRLHPAGMVYGGPIFYPIERAADVLRFYREFMAGAPEELSVFFAFLIAPPAPFIPEHLQETTMCALVACHLGTLEQAERDIQPMRAFLPPLIDLAGPIPFPVLNSLFDALLPAGLHHYWKADFVNDLSDAAIDVHVEHGTGVPSLLSGMHIYPLSGAQQRVGRHDTAFNYRDANFVHVIFAINPELADTQAQVGWVRSYWEALRPHSLEGTYVNFLMDEGEERIAASYRDNFARLAEIKARYDPANLFRMNQNIRPAGR